MSVHQQRVFFFKEEKDEKHVVVHVYRFIAIDCLDRSRSFCMRNFLPGLASIPPSSMTLPTLDFAETALPGSFGSFSFDTSGGFGSTLDISLLPYSPINLSSIADLLFGQEEEIDTEEFLPKETFLIIGTIDYVGLEGGFYAIEGDDGPGL